MADVTGGWTDADMDLMDMVTQSLDMWSHDSSTDAWNYTSDGNDTDHKMMMSTTMSTTTTTSMTTSSTAQPCYTWTQPPCDGLIQAAYNLVKYGIYVAYVIGIPGSILTLTILSRMRPFNSSTTWLCCLACTDLCGLTLRMILSIYQSYWGWVTWWCRLFYIMARTTKNVSFLCLVGLTVERFIAVWFPLKMAAWCTIRRALISFFVITIIVISADLHMIETRRTSPWGGRCVIRLKYRVFWQNTYEKYILMTFYQTIPMVTLITLNILIAVRLRSARKVQKKMTDDKNKEKEKQQKQIDRMLLAATIMFCLFVLPEIIFQYSEFAWAAKDRYKEFIRDRARHIIVMMSNTLNVFNHAVNFILYVLVAQKFRAEIIRLFTCGKYTGFFQRAEPVLKK